MKQSYSKPAAKAFQLKVALQRAESPAWKRIVVPAGIKFSRLRAILTEMMGNFGGHLYAFRFEEEKRILNHVDKQGRAFVGAVPGDGEYERSDAREVVIDDLLREGGVFYFDCDFGDVCVYEIKVESLLADGLHGAPRVIESTEAGAGDPDDSAASRGDGERT
ncbi:MAG: plasmid pRiA4b ORF-3 family protein, partial [Clostridiales Family XIII bacterium]|nr:plasmid pRiA4b ORF-3 family protein [Clostridiales Family XIII bacterium]